MSSNLERCLCGGNSVVTQSRESKITAACQSCWYESPSFTTEAEAVSTHNRMMRAARGEAVSSTLQVEHSIPLEVARCMQNQWALIVSQLEKEVAK